MPVARCCSGSGWRRASSSSTFLVTPARILFLVVLVGTTLELLTERFRRARLEARWRSRVNDHTIVAGYRTVTRAREAGLVAIAADATHTAVRTQARVDVARAVMVTCSRDDTATLVTLTAVGLATESPVAVRILEDLLRVGEGIDLVERPVQPDEIGGPPHNDGELAVGLVRGGQRSTFGDEAVQRTAPGDVMMSLVRRDSDGT